MDETALRARLELAVSDEPPLGQLIGNALRAGRRLRRRRRTGAASLSAAAVVLIGVVPAMTAGADHHQEPSSSQAGSGTTAWIQGGNRIVPVDLATQTAGTAITAGGGSFGTLETTNAITPDGRTLYALEDFANPATVTPIDTATDTAERPITLPKGDGQTGLAIAANGKTLYVAGRDGVEPISTTTNTAGKLIDIGAGYWWQPTLTPDGKRLYVLSETSSTVAVVRTTNDVAGKSISLPAPKKSGYSRILSDIVFTPDNRTGYVLEAAQDDPAGGNSVVPISVAANRALAPIKVGPSGTADCLVMAPDGRTVYVLTSRAVTPINTSTNRAEPSIGLPRSAGSASFMIGSPDGKMLYLLTSRGVLPINTVSDTVRPIIDVPMIDSFAQQIAITPNGRTIYVAAMIRGTKNVFGHALKNAAIGGGVVAISTATDTAGRFVNLDAALRRATVSAIVFGP